MPSMKRELRLETLRWASMSFGLLAVGGLMSEAESVDSDGGRDRAHALVVGGYITGGLGAGTMLAGFMLANRYEDRVVWPIIGLGIGVVGAGVQAVVLGRRERAASSVVVSPTSNGIAIAGAF
jgi:hypothetical protein